MAPAAGDWGCPATVYDTPDVRIGSSTAIHTAVKWSRGDSCIWLGSDEDGTDNSCGAPIPNNGCCSLFTSNSYASPAVLFSAANWMMRVVRF